MTTRDRIEQLLAKEEAAVRAAFRQFLASVKSEKVMKEVASLLAGGNLEGALGIVDTYVVRMGKIIPKVFERAGDAEAEAVASMLGSRISIGLSFDPGDARAANIARQQTMEFIQGFSEQQREATRLAVSNALQEGSGRLEAARAFRGSIGLTGRQEAAVASYRNLLKEGSAEALNRDLRDRRFDRTIRRAARESEPLSKDQIDMMVGRYRERFLAYRSETIARTESLRAVSAGRAEAFAQTMEQAGLRPGEVERVWNATRDGRTRDTHRAMNGQVVVGMDTPFVSPSGAKLLFPGDPKAPAEEVINCRCAVTFRLKKEAA